MTPARCIAKGCNDGPDLDGNPGPRLADHGLLCRRHADRLERDLAEMPAHAAHLRSILGGSQAPRPDGSRRTKGTPPIPLNITAHDLLQLMRFTLGAWKEQVAEDRGLRGPDRQTVTALSSWLAGQVDWLTQQEWVGDLAEEVHDIARAADGLTQTRPGWHTLPAPCPGCGGTHLGRWDGDDHVGCAECGERWHEDEYQRLCLVLASDPAWSLTATQAAQRAEVEPATFRQWVSRGHVRRVGTLDGVARYSTQDVDEQASRSSCPNACYLSGRCQCSA